MTKKSKMILSRGKIDAILAANQTKGPTSHREVCREAGRSKSWLAIMFARTSNVRFRTADQVARALTRLVGRRVEVADIVDTEKV